jgi:hypothetical protein
MVMMPELAPVTDETQRADLARWAVSLRRAHVAGTRQVTGNLHMRNVPDLGDDDYDDDDETEEAAALGGDSYCCLGIWCRVQLAAGVLQVRTVRQAAGYARAGAAEPDGGPLIFSEGALPAAALLAGSGDPDLLMTIPQDNGATDPNFDLAEWLTAGNPEREWWAENESTTLTAAELNDDCGCNFAQIADIVVWRFGLTDAELAAAELAPRVPEVEGAA